MSILKELESFIDSEFEEIDEFENLVRQAWAVMGHLHTEIFTDLVYEELADIVGTEYLEDHMDRLIDALGVETKLDF